MIVFVKYIIIKRYFFLEGYKKKKKDLGFLELQLLRREFFVVSNQCSITHCVAFFEVVKSFQLGRYIDMKMIPRINAWEFIVLYESK